MRCSPATPFPPESFDATLLCVMLASRAYRGNEHPRYPAGIEARLVEMLALPGVAEQVAAIADHLRWEASDQVVSWLAREQGMQRLCQLARKVVAEGEPLPPPEAPAIASFVASQPAYAPILEARLPPPILSSPPRIPDRAHASYTPEVVSSLESMADAAEAEFEALLAGLESGE